MAQKKKILIVDDTPDILEALELVLGIEGYDVVRATTQEEVDTILATSVKLPNLILLDVLLSGQDGRIITKRLKTSTQFQHIPIILMSAHPHMANTVKESGANDFLPKPFEIDALLAKVKQHLEKA